MSALQVNFQRDQDTRNLAGSGVLLVELSAWLLVHPTDRAVGGSAGEGGAGVA